MTLFALAIAPGIAICIYFLLKDEYNREPRKHIFISFLLGVLSCFVAIILELSLEPLLNRAMPAGILRVALMAFVVVGFSEEWAKYLFVRHYSYKKESFDEPFDGIVYSVMVSMGFATFENIFYVMEHGMATAFLRMFLSVPAHACFAILMGYYLGKSKFDNANRKALLLQGLLMAAFFHGAFDFFLFLQEDKLVTRYVSELMLFGGAVVSYIIAIILSRKAIKSHMLTSREMHGAKEVGEA